MRIVLAIALALGICGCEKPAPASPEAVKVEQPAPYVDRKNAELKELKVDVQNTVDGRSAEIEARTDSPEN